MIVLFCGLLTLWSSSQVFAEDAPRSRTEQNVDSAADALFDDYWQDYLRDHPEAATGLGEHRYDDRLDCYSLECYEKRKVTMDKFLERAKKLLPLAEEGSDTYNNLQMFAIFLQFRKDQLTDRSYLFPISSLSTPKMNLIFLLSYVQLENAKNCWDLIARYRAFPKQIDEIIELMREGMRTNYTLSEYSLWTPKDEQSSSVTESVFYKPFSNIPSSISAEEASLIQSNASDAVTNSVYAALKKLDDFIDKEYRPNCRKEIGVSSLPNGSEFYRQELMGQLTDRSVTPAAIHAMGVEEVERINSEMKEVIKSLGLNLTREEFDDKLRHDETNFYTSGEEAVEAYRRVIFNVISPKLPLIFKKIPKMALKVEKVSADMAGGPLAYYMGASPDNSTPATFYVDTNDIKALPKYEVMTLSLHEGNPGHHFQISYAMEQRGVPEFRKHLSASTAYIEGWALYAEYLGNELGLFEDPYAKYGHLSNEIFRACRLVVDTGMHVFGWSRQRAIDFMAKYFPSTLESIIVEIDRYITWPGQACAYKYGELKIKEMRKKAESALGDKFDVKEFHDVVLRNSGPLQLVEKQVDRYIQSAKSS